MSANDEFIPNSLESDAELPFALLQPLGNLLTELSRQNIDATEKGYDSDETILSEGSCELSIIPSTGKNGALCATVLPGDHSLSPILYLSQAEDTSIPPKVSSLYPLTSMQSSETPQTVNEQNSNCKQSNQSIVHEIAVTEGVLTRRKRRRNEVQVSDARQLNVEGATDATVASTFDENRLFAKSRPSSSQPSSTTITAFSKGHCSQMEELNIIEAKFASILQLISIKLRSRVERANAMLTNDVRLRLDHVRKDIDERIVTSPCSSDSEEEEEAARLCDVRKQRLENLSQRYKEIEVKIRDSLVNISDGENNEESDCECSQSILISSTKRKSTARVDRTESFYKSKMVHVLTVSQKTAIRSTKKVKSGTLNRGDIACRAGSSGSVIGTPNKICEGFSFPFVNAISSGTASQPSRSVAFEARKKKKTQKISQKSYQNLGNYQAMTSTAATFPSQTTMAMPDGQTRAPSIRLESEGALRKKQGLFQTPGAVYCTTSVPIQVIPSATQTSLPCTNVVVLPPSCPSNINILPNLRDLVRRGLVARGRDNLCCNVKGGKRLASIFGEGLILSFDCRTYTSPEAWLSFEISSAVGAVDAYKMISYNGTALYDIATRQVVAQPRQQESGTSESCSSGQINMKPSAAPRAGPSDTGDLCSYLRRCKFVLPADDELFVQSCLLGADEPEQDRIFEELASASW